VEEQVVEEMALQALEVGLLVPPVLTLILELVEPEEPKLEVD
jgi:hypothetical protein